MAIYRADIAIAVRGATQVTNLQQRLNTLNANVNQLNATLRSGTVSSLNNLNNLVAQSDRIMRSAAQGTRVQREAIDAYVRSIAAAERAETSLQRAIGRRRRELGLAAPAPSGGRGGSFGSRIGGAVSGAVIGGSFPLLFGQGAGAAAGGAIGGLAGGLLGPGGSFAGSLLGTLLGDLASKGNLVKKLGEDIGFSAEQTRILEGAFKQAGAEFDKFESSVQNIRGLGLDIESQANAIKLVSALTKEYGGQIDKTTNAYTSALEAGKVTQATLNQLTSQGIPIQQALADKYNVSRSQLLQMAKDGKISVQELSDTLIELGNSGVNATEKTKTGFDNLSTATGNLGTALSRLGGTIVTSLQGPLDWLSNRLASIVDAAARGIGRISDLLAGGKQAQASIQASAEAQRLTRNKFGVRAINPFDKDVQQFRTAQEKDIFRRLSGTQLGPSPAAIQGRIGGITVPGQLPPSGGGGGKKAAAPPEDRTQQLIEEFNAIVAIGKAEDQIRDLLFDGREILAAQAELAKQVADIERDRNKALLGANYESEKAVINKIAEARIVDAQLQNEDKLRAIKQKRFEDELDMQDAIRSSVQVFTDMRKERELEAQYAKKYGSLLREGVLPAEAERIANFEKIVRGTLQQLDLEIAITQNKILQGQADGMAVDKLQKELDLLQKKKEAITGAAAAGPGQGPTDVERLQEAADAVRGQLNTLIDPINQIVAGANAIGSAFGNAFKGLISGSMSAREALAGFFQSVADHFLDMASQIIAKWIEMTILNTILSLFPGGASLGFGGAGDPLGAGGAFWNANGNAFGANGIVPFANGGVVSSPTVFPFANGGAMSTGIMGEAGPEAIMPLKRGADGRLGVSASTQALERYRPVPTGRGGGGGGEAGGQGEAGGTYSSTIDVRYNVERINNVDYVTADQFQQGLRQAASEGAARGEQRTMRRLQQSPTTRRRLGV